MDQTDETLLSPAARAALEALARCTLTELGAIEMFHFRRVKRRVAVRTAVECAAKVAAERGAEAARPEPTPWTPELEAEARLQGRGRPVVMDGQILDEDGDEILEPTPLVRPE